MRTILRETAWQPYRRAERTDTLLIEHREFLEQRAPVVQYSASLRCALVEDKRERAWLVLARFHGIGSDYRALIVQLIAGLYASHPLECHDGDLGSACRAFLSEQERLMMDSTRQVGPVSRRVQHLLAADGEEVFPRVRRLVQRAKADDIPINYARLIEDLMEWRYDPDAVRARWARGFWAPGDAA